jgi:uncharacterized protein YdbL (DUF1318 family)
MNNFLKTLLLTATITCICFSSAFAMDLNAAKKSGLVGEKPNGLIESTLPNPSPDLSELINKTNAGRIELYKNAAEQQNIPLKEVQAIAARKIYDLATPGDFLLVDGKWIKK